MGMDPFRPGPPDTVPGVLPNPDNPAAIGINRDTTIALFAESLQEWLPKTDHSNVRRRLGIISDRVSELAEQRLNIITADLDGRVVAIEVKRRVGSQPQPGTPRPAYDVGHELVHNALDADYLRPYGDTGDEATSAQKAGATVFRWIVADANVLTAAHLDALPAYVTRPFLTRDCCPAAPSVPARADADEADVRTQLLAYAELLRATVTRLIVDFTNRRQFHDYAAGLLQIVDVLLASARRMFVVVLAAFAHQATTPSFVLIMLGSIRHYGHRGEPDHLTLPARVLRSNQQQGTVRLAA